MACLPEGRRKNAFFHTKSLDKIATDSLIFWASLTSVNQLLQLT